MSDGLEMWAVYDHPTDHPDHFVARLWVVDGRGGVVATPTLVRHGRLDRLRAFLADRGLVRLDRCEEDEPHIVETWL